MSEYNIANNADVFSVDKTRTAPWICRDDSGNYWTIFQNTSQNIDIYKSTNLGVTWTLMKTLTSADFTSLTMPIDNFNIVNLTGQNKVYIMLYKTTQKVWGWKINTLTNSGSVDLDNVLAGNSGTGHATAIRWDSYNNKLYLMWGATSNMWGFYSEIPLNGTLSAFVNPTFTYTNQRAYGFNIDNQGRKLFAAVATSGVQSMLYRGITSFTKIDVAVDNVDFVSVLADYNGQGIYCYVNGGVIHLYKANLAFTAWELSNYYFTLAGGAICTSAYFALDGLNNVYVIYTSSTDGESYSAKFDITSAVWGTSTQISSNNDGLQVSCELASPLASNTILTTYQATV